MNYFNNVCNYLINAVKNILKKDCLVVSDDKRNIRLIANNKTSETFNIYRITCYEDLINIVNNVCKDLA